MTSECPGDDRITTDEARTLVEVLTGVQHGPVCNFVLVTIHHGQDGTHGFKVSSPLLPDRVAVERVLRGAGIAIRRITQNKTNRR